MKERSSTDSSKELNDLVNSGAVSTIRNVESEPIAVQYLNSIFYSSYVLDATRARNVGLNLNSE